MSAVLRVSSVFHSIHSSFTNRLYSQHSRKTDYEMSIPIFSLGINLQYTPRMIVIHFFPKYFKTAHNPSSITEPMMGNIADSFHVKVSPAGSSSSSSYSSEI